MLPNPQKIVAAICLLLSLTACAAATIGAAPPAWRRSEPIEPNPLRYKLPDNAFRA